MIRNGGEGEKLEMLGKKWIAVAREVGWEVRRFVENNVRDVSKLGGGGGALQNNWWADEGDKGCNDRCGEGEQTR